MKTYKLSLLLLSLSLFACENKPKLDPPEPMVYDEVVIIKMSSEIIDGIVVTPTILSAKVNYQSQSTILTYEDSLALCNTQPDYLLELSKFVIQELDVYAQPHYIFLTEDYAIVNWRWRYFNPLSAPWIYAKDGSRFSPNPYGNNGAIENEEYYILNESYNELPNLRATWPIEGKKRIQLPELRYISYKKLDEYRKDSLLDSSQRLVSYDEGLDILRLFRIYEQNKDWKSYVSLYDSLENVYNQTIKGMINNNDLERWTIKRK